MATIRERKNGSWECVVRRSCLPRPHYATFDSEAAARDYAAKLERLLDQGIIPPGLLPTGGDEEKPRLVADAVAEYLKRAHVSALDAEVSGYVLAGLAGARMDRLTHAWADGWLSAMKGQGLAPGTIRKRVGMLARCLDWWVRKGDLAVNPLRQLPRGYASYALGDGAAVVDVERDRRLLPGEKERLLAILDGAVPEGKQRGIALADRAAWRLLFVLATETAMRLREMYTLGVEQVDLGRRTVFLDKTKNGDKRQVPLSSVALAALAAHLPGCDAMVFPWWDGRIESLEKTTSKLSRKWGTIATMAGCEDLHFHDLRHEATCRFYELTAFSDLQIAKITGHKDLRMLRRYANLRGSDLADGLW